MRRTLYWKRLLIVVAATLLAGGAVFAVHHFQANAQASVVLARAQKVAEAAETDPAQRTEAIALFKRYLKFRPTDEAAFQKYANLLFDDAAADPAQAAVAADGAEGFLRAFPNHPAERKKLAELYIATHQVNKLATARQHLEILLTAPGGEYRDSIEVRAMASQCEHLLNNLPAAIAHLEAAIATGKAPVKVYVTAMQLHFANKEDPKRNVSIDDHLRALRTGRFEKDLEARVAAARFETALGNLGPARGDMKVAFDALGGGEDPDALLAMAELELAAAKTPEQVPEQYAKAEALLQKAFAKDKKNVAVGMKLAEVLAARGKRAEGVAILKQTADALGPVAAGHLVVIDRLIDLGEKELSAALVEGKLAPDEKFTTIVTYFRGRLAILKQDWTAALKLLDEAAPNLVRMPLYHKKAMMGLAACYAAVQNPDKQLEFCRLALQDDGGYIPAIVGEAEALVRMGKHDEALKKYRAIVNALHLEPYRGELVRLELLDVLSQTVDPEARNWRRFIDSLGAEEARTPEIHVYDADSRVARGRPQEGTNLLRAWLEKHPKDGKAAAVWVALARVKDGGRPDSAAVVLDEAQKALGDAVELRLARVGLLVARAKPATVPELDALAANADHFTKSEQFRLMFGLGQAAARVADRGPDGDAARAVRAAALKYLTAAAALDPKDLACRAALLDQALAADQTDLVNQAIREMAVVEGEGGAVGTLARIAVELPKVRQVADPAARAARVKELRAWAGRVRDLRPGWSRVYIALAQLDELEGLNDAALLNYTEAINKGDRQEYVIRRAVELHRVKQQDDQALGLLNKMSTEVRLPDDLERYRAIRNMLTTDLPRESRGTIDRIAPFESPDYRIVLLRGALLAAVREDDQALLAFKHAVAMVDTVPETWASLVAQLMKHGRVEDARRAVAEAKKKLADAPPKKDGSPADAELALAGLHEMIGDLKAAQGHYAAAYKIAPLDLNATRQLVLFLQRTGQGEEATRMLKEATGSGIPDVARWARRHLALTLVARPDAYTVRAEALALIETNLATAPNDAEDLKARAYVETIDPTTREEAVRVLRQFGDRGDLTPDEYYLLGRLAFDQGKFAEAERYFKFGARVKPGVTSEHLAAVVRVYLALGRVDLAEAAAERLRATFPTSWEATREEARVLARKGKDRAAAGEPDDAKKLLAQARAAVAKYPGWDAGANLATRSGPLFEELGLTADAETAYAKYLAADGPNAHAPLAVFYIRQRQPEKAIKLAREHEAKAGPLLTARLLTGAVRARRPDPVTEAEVGKWLDAALRAAAGKPELEAGLIAARAELLDAQGKYDDAIRDYELALAKAPSDYATNNLCMLLALKQPERAKEAVKRMTDLIAIRGPVPAFLDTLAVAHIVSGAPEEAEKDLRMALVQYDRAAYRYHLAWAIDLAEGSKRVFAAKELEAGKRLGLTAADLHPLEYRRYVELLTTYKMPLDDK